MTKSNWPTKDILWFGSFGTDTPAGARYQKRAGLALILMVMGVGFSSLFPTAKPLTAAIPGVAFAYIAWEWWVYLQQLDELGRRLQMEAMAFTYVLGVFVMMALGGLGFIMDFRLNPALFILLEPIRAWRLLVLARRYE